MYKTEWITTKYFKSVSDNNRLRLLKIFPHFQHFSNTPLQILKVTQNDKIKMKSGL